MHRLDRFVWLLKSPILWGLFGAAGFYALVFYGPLDVAFIRRYFTNHPVEYGETVLFAIGLAALVLKSTEIAAQHRGLRISPLGAPCHGSDPVQETCPLLLERLEQLSPHRHNEYYVRRLRAALQRIERQGSSEGLDDELKYLAELDVDQQQGSYGLFRVIVWAIPILGFLGTVVGITMALNGLDPQALDESMLHVTTGLGVKFDTTALALSMSMGLMFIHFFVERAELSLLARVDQRVEDDLHDRFPSLPAGPDGQWAAMRQAIGSLGEMTDRLLQQQAQLWQESMEALGVRVGDIADAIGKRVEQSVADGLARSIAQHAQQLASSEKSALEVSLRHLEKMERAQSQHSKQFAALQTDVGRQGELLARVLESAGEVTRLQDLLNRNLASLAGAKHIEQTVLGLAAAVHLLNARLAESSTVPLESVRANAHAA